MRDLRACLAFYRDALGFAAAFQYGEPCFYACLRRDDVALHLIAANETKRAPGHSALCVFVKDADGNKIVFGASIAPTP